MFRIRHITDVTLPTNQEEIAEVQAILRMRFTGLPAHEIDGLPDKIANPLAHKLSTFLLVADDLRGNLKGFALMSYAPDLDFWILDFVATGRALKGSGIGGALYTHARKMASEKPSAGLFMECLPDDPADCEDPASARENAARLKFYERYGARPIVGTGYETPISPGDKDLPHLVWDDLDSGEPLRRDRFRDIVRAILERKYEHLCTPEYIQGVVDSVTDDPVRIREPRYTKPARAASVSAAKAPEVSAEDRIVLVVNEKHDIHHVRERGYVESPIRVRSILKGLDATPDHFWRIPARDYPMSHIRAVHDDRLVNYLEKACASVEPGKSIYPYVFPVRNNTRPPKDLGYAAGYYCIDTFTPLNQNAFLAARGAVNCTLTAADAILSDARLAYSLVRPPGHHAERSTFGGFCYFCNGAVAAHYLSGFGRVAMLDLDYHHGNGQQDIFYSRPDVLTVSIHGHPSFAYPFFTGFEDEVGESTGTGFNLNLPLPEVVDGPRYLKAVKKALARIQEFAPRFLVLSMGFDTGKGDPTGTWTLAPADFEAIGLALGATGWPILVVQEGGYRTTSLPANARAFFSGLHAAATARPAGSR
ncbi:Acetylpolyamine aminohydrolase [Planctomycetes bacterium Poly30]|uniref:Acetylpolyamine aminohydrolase n=1 Tax=Saltatorellus ferox TaxID=2528018 RepID=A0A518EW73_9BACT|nr:Acetylpolyamine aminohydrolase [Planctomycetes bacterium Poly30]